MIQIAIVILNWNGIDHLKQFLPGVIAHSKVENAHVEVIVADNGSTDESVQWLKTLTDTIQVIQLDRNYGFAGGYNRALKQVESDYYVILNSDVEVKPNWLTPLINFMEANPQAAACMPKINSYSSPEYFEYAGAAGGFLDRWGYPFCRGRILNVLEEDHGQYDEIKEVFWATGAALFIKSTDFWQAGGFDEDFFAHMEEIDLCWRIKSNGKSIWCVPQSTVLHVGGGTLSAENPRKVYFNHRNNLIMLLKNLTALQLAGILIIRYVLDWIAAMGYLLTGKPKFTWAVFRAHCHFLQHVPSAIKKRKKRGKTKVNLYPSSILIHFFLLGRKQFSQFPPKNYL